mmetsp:Transcript_19304/g.44901  ORF Transcript_19304/g.44901 Transcript_19304/m.44901 type:complete len:203 (+) Transcript_19304:1032-1640(+)
MLRCHRQHSRCSCTETGICCQRQEQAAIHPLSDSRNSVHGVVVAQELWPAQKSGIDAVKIEVRPHPHKPAGFEADGVVLRRHVELRASSVPVPAQQDKDRQGGQHKPPHLHPEPPLRLNLQTQHLRPRCRGKIVQHLEPSNYPKEHETCLLAKATGNDEDSWYKDEEQRAVILRTATVAWTPACWTCWQWWTEAPSIRTKRH